MQTQYTGLDKQNISAKIVNIFLPIISAYVVVLLSTHNICFGREIRKLFFLFNIKSRPQGYKTFSCSTQLSTKFQLLIKTKISTNEDLVSCFKSLR